MADQSLRRDIKKLKNLHYRNTTFHDKAFDQVHLELATHGDKIDEVVNTLESLQDDIRAHTANLDLVKTLTDMNRDLKKQIKTFEEKIESQIHSMKRMQEKIKSYHFATESSPSPSASASASRTITPGSNAQSITPSPPRLDRVTDVADIQEGIARFSITDAH